MSSFRVAWLVNNSIYKTHSTLFSGTDVLPNQLTFQTSHSRQRKLCARTFPQIGYALNSMRAQRAISKALIALSHEPVITYRAATHIRQSNVCDVNSPENTK